MAPPAESTSRSSTQTEWARLLIAGAVDAGVRHAVISPGSRSTPFVFAALEHPQLQCWSILDERAAAFFALGQAKANGRPSLLICTSGSAPAHYLPAVIEAHEAQVPLFVLSADRPPELHACRDNQTTDQTALFSGKLRYFADLGVPEPEREALEGVYRRAFRAAEAAAAPLRGPVHLNAAARKPLEPVVGVNDAVAAAATEIRSRPLQRAAATPPSPTTSELAALVGAIRSSTRGLIACGPGDLNQATLRASLLRLSSATGFPIVADAASQMRFVAEGADHVIGAHDALWRSSGARVQLAPDLVLQIGNAPIAKGWSLLLQEAQPRHICLSDAGWSDPDRTIDTFVFADLKDTVEAVVATLARGESKDWFTRVRTAEEIAWREASTLLDEQGDALTEAGAVTTVLEHIPREAQLALGNSLPIRQVDGWVRPSDKPLQVLSQRGVSGIDGGIAGAAGSASVADQPTVLITGDVAFLHDLTGLQAAASIDKPLVVVVLNNGGGRIFEQLPIATADERFLRFLTTPHDADLAAATRVFGVRHASVDSRSALALALDTAVETPACTVVEAKVPASGAIQLNRRLWKRVDEALERLKS